MSSRLIDFLKGTLSTVRPKVQLVLLLLKNPEIIVTLNVLEHKLYARMISDDVYI